MRPAYHFDEFCFRSGVFFGVINFGVMVVSFLVPFWCQAPLKDICPPIEDTSVDECHAPDGRK
ncbi:hypothetical protein V7157_02380 [Neobacillus drentensis]|uniref:hypothetical protein n=1 Tax=Neobacillus drentensis TaxID=220684 RepID=UPI002FFEB0A4